MMMLHPCVLRDLHFHIAESLQLLFLNWIEEILGGTYVKPFII